MESLRELCLIGKPAGKRYLSERVFRFQQRCRRKLQPTRKKQVPRCAAYKCAEGASKMDGVNADALAMSRTRGVFSGQS